MAGFDLPRVPCPPNQGNEGWIVEDPEEDYEDISEEEEDEEEVEEDTDSEHEVYNPPQVVQNPDGTSRARCPDRQLT